jgi:putative acetyltransferase
MREEDRRVRSGVIVRAARPRDAASFVEGYRGVVAERRFLQAEEVRSPLRVYRRRFRRSWTSEAAHLLAVEGDRVVGSLSIRRDVDPVTRHVATLGMFVVADRRSRGIGSALMAEGVRWARRHGVLRVELAVYPHNEAAITLYRKFGFDVEGRLVRHAMKSYGYEDEILMAVWLGSEEGERA